MKTPFLNYTRTTLCFLLWASACWVCQAEDNRLWTSSDGRTLEARLLDASTESITVARSLDGATFSIPVARLSSEDQAYVVAYLASQEEQSADRPAAADSEVDYSKVALVNLTKSLGNLTYREFKQSIGWADGAFLSDGQIGEDNASRELLRYTTQWLSQNDDYTGLFNVDYIGVTPSDILDSGGKVAATEPGARLEESIDYRTGTASIILSSLTPFLKGDSQTSLLSNWVLLVSATELGEPDYEHKEIFRIESLDEELQRIELSRVGEASHHRLWSEESWIYPLIQINEDALSPQFLVDVESLDAVEAVAASLRKRFLAKDRHVWDQFLLDDGSASWKIRQKLENDTSIKFTEPLEGNHATAIAIKVKRFTNRLDKALHQGAEGDFEVLETLMKSPLRFIMSFDADGVYVDRNNYQDPINHRFFTTWLNGLNFLNQNHRSIAMVPWDSVSVGMAAMTGTEIIAATGANMSSGNILRNQESFNWLGDPTSPVLYLGDLMENSESLDGALGEMYYAKNGKAVETNQGTASIAGKDGRSPSVRLPLPELDEASDLVLLMETSSESEGLLTASLAPVAAPFYSDVFAFGYTDSLGQTIRYFPQDESFPVTVYRTVGDSDGPRNGYTWPLRPEREWEASFIDLVVTVPENNTLLKFFALKSDSESIDFNISVIGDDDSGELDSLTLTKSYLPHELNLADHEGETILLRILTSIKNESEETELVDEESVEGKPREDIALSLTDLRFVNDSADEDEVDVPKYTSIVQGSPVGPTESSASFGFHDVPETPMLLELTWHGGEPLNIENLRILEDDNVVYQTFEQGLVLINPGSESVEFELNKIFADDNYVWVSGDDTSKRVYGDVTLKARSSIAFSID